MSPDLTFKETKLIIYPVELTFNVQAQVWTPWLEDTTLPQPPSQIPTTLFTPPPHPTPVLATLTCCSFQQTCKPLALHKLIPVANDSFSFLHLVNTPSFSKPSWMPSPEKPVFLQAETCYLCSLCCRIWFTQCVLIIFLHICLHSWAESITGKRLLLVWPVFVASARTW